VAHGRDAVGLDARIAGEISGSMFEAEVSRRRPYRAGAQARE